MLNKVMVLFAIVSIVASTSNAQNILGQLLGLEQPLSREAAEQAEIFSEHTEPKPEPSLAELINAEKSNYPKLVSTTEYETRSDCVMEIWDIYNVSLSEGIYAIPRMDFWLDRYIGDGREIYICDGSLLNAYHDDNNSVPVRWRMVRSSVDLILSQLDDE